MQPAALANGTMVGQDPRSVPANLDPHQHAALAMTELQQQSGGSVADFSAGYASNLSIKAIANGGVIANGQQHPFLPDAAWVWAAAASRDGWLRSGQLHVADGSV
jgi:hypothetical protein